MVPAVLYCTVLLFFYLVPAVLYCTVLLFFYLDMEETEGTLYLSQTPSWRRRSLLYCTVLY